jgi:hypothetical protein
MNNSNYDNKVSNSVVNVLGTLIRTFERVFIVFWDGLRSATVHGTPSLVGFFAALAPLLTPLPMAAMTAIHMQKYLGWYPWQAWLMAAGLEVVGFPLWVFVTEAIFVDGWKGTSRQISLMVAVAVYEVIIIAINAILSWQNGDNFTLVAIFFLACFIPALGGMAYSYSNRKNEAALAKEREELQNADIRREKSEERLKAKMIKQGINPFQQAQVVTLNSDTVQPSQNREKHASDYRDKAIEFIKAYRSKNSNSPSPKQVTERFGLDHTRNKGYMSTLIRDIENGKF